MGMEQVLLCENLLVGRALHGQDGQRLAVLAKEIYERSPLPLANSEEWKFTSLNGLADRRILPSVHVSETVTNLSTARDLPRLTFVNGFFSESLSSSIDKLSSEGIDLQICDYGSSDRVDSDRVDSDKADSYRQFFDYYPLAALSVHAATAPLDIVIRKSCDVRLQILFVGDNQQELSHHGHCLRFRLENDSRLELFEKHISAHETSQYVHHDFLRFDVCDGAKLVHHKLQLSSNSSTHLGHADVHLGRKSCYEYGLVSLGGDLSRQDVHVHLLGERASAEIRSLLLPIGGQVQHLSTDLRHLVADCESSQRVKIIAGDSSKATYQGRVHIAKSASGSIGQQQSRGLLLDRRSEINNKPELEIFTDAVECAHGSAVGELEEAPLFYLKSRGIDEWQAYDLLLKSYVNEVAEFFEKSHHFLEFQLCLAERMREYANYLQILKKSRQ